MQDFYLLLHEAKTSERLFLETGLLAFPCWLWKVLEPVYLIQMLAREQRNKTMTRRDADLNLHGSVVRSPRSDFIEG